MDAVWGDEWGGRSMGVLDSGGYGRRGRKGVNVGHLFVINGIL